MKKIVYFLGAGFSRPWGLPLMDDFIHKSKDLFIMDENKYHHFKDFYNLIDNYSKIKNIINIDLYNIENLLSLVEMSEQVVDEPIVKMVKDFIADVIKAYTNPFKPYGRLPGNWQDFIFGSDQCQQDYIYFIANLINLTILKVDNDGSFATTINPEPEKRYAIVSLNYDMLIENSLDFIKSQYPLPNCLLSKEKYDPTWSKLNFAKIHGSVDTDEIIPPTWNKSRSNEVLNKWNLAFNILSNANTIRIVGYSLPESDTYIKYLLGIAIKHNFHLEKIEATCIDSQGIIQKRYESFFLPKYFKFENLGFFDSIRSKLISQKKANRVIMEGLG